LIYYFRKPLEVHLDHVYKYFGGPGFASCLGSDFPDYPGELDNVKIHRNMGMLIEDKIDATEERKITFTLFLFIL
jgi:hypothetical protein